MEQLKILVNNDSINIVNNRITGEIFFSIDDVYFPEDRWNDYIITLLDWWLESASKVKVAKIGESIELHFMDGPFLIQIMKQNADFVKLLFIKRNFDKKEIIHSYNCAINDFNDLLYSTSKKVLDFISQKGWISEEIIGLQTKVNK